MLATGGSRARGRRRGQPMLRLGAAVTAVAALLAMAAGPAIAESAPRPTASVADGVRLAIIVPITVPAERVGVIPAESLAEFTAPNGLLSRQLDAVDRTAAILAIDPMILASIRVLGSAAPPSARTWLARLEALQNERFALPYADADPTLFLRSTAADLLGPSGFDAVIDPANFASPEPVDPTATPTPEPTATPDPTATPGPTPTPGPAAPTPVPTLADAILVSGATDSVAWPRTGTIAEGDLAALSATTVVLGQADAPDAASGLATVGGIRALVIDPTVSAAVQTAAGAADDVSWSAASSAASAALVAAVESQTTPTATVVVALDRLAGTNAARLAATLTAMTTDPAVQLVGLEALAAGEAPEAALVAGVQDAARVDAINARLTADGLVQGFATAVATPATLTEPERLTTLALGSQSWIGRQDWPDAVAGAAADVAALLASVHVIEGSFQFFADRSNLPVAIQNDGTQSVTVLVAADPRTGLLDIDRAPVQLVVPAGSQATAEFAATAVSNGAVNVTVTMTSPAGVPIGTAATAEVNVQAGWETPIIAAAAIAVGVLLVFGVVRTVRRIRARSAEDEGDFSLSSPRQPQRPSRASESDEQHE